MLKKILLPTILLILAYGFYTSQDFNQIAAGVAIFLFGMVNLEQGFNLFTGGFLEKILQKTTNTLSKSVCFGIVSTTLMQSSSLVSVITISFLSAGLISLAAGIGIIFGANLGTTTGAWLIAGFGLKVNISAFAMPMLVFGLVLLFQKNSSLKGVGYILSGLGFLFLGIHFMKEGFDAFKNTIDLMAFSIDGFLGLFVFTLLGIFATVVMQSSHATLVLIITALAAGQISYENGLALAIGANVGTTITAILGSISANYQGKQLALAHLIFNIATGLIAIVFINQLIFIVEFLSGWLGIDPQEYTLKLAIFHSLFNLIGVVVMFPFIHKLVQFLQKAIQASKKDYATPKYLNQAVVDFPETLIRAVQDEIKNLYDINEKFVIKALHLDKNTIQSENLKKDIIKQTKRNNFDVNKEFKHTVYNLASQIIRFIAENGSSVSYKQSQQLYKLEKISGQIVTVAKDAKHLSLRMGRGISSENLETRKEYNLIRIHIVCALKEIRDFIKKEMDSKTFESELNYLLVNFARENAKSDFRLNEKIKRELIDSPTVFMLKTDRNYENNIMQSLVYIASHLFSELKNHHFEFEQTLNLTKKELKKIKNNPIGI